MADKQLAIALVGTDEASGVVGQSARKMAADLEAQGKTAEAITKYEEVRRRFATDPVGDQTKMALARLYEQQNQPAEALKLIRRGVVQLAFFLAPTPVSDVQAVADARSRMPQKSTDFYPKLLSGMVMYEVK